MNIKDRILLANLARHKMDNLELARHICFLIGGLALLVGSILNIIIDLRG